MYTVTRYRQPHTCNTEVLGEAASYFDPNDADDLASKIRLGLRDEDL